MRDYLFRNDLDLTTLLSLTRQSTTNVCINNKIFPLTFPSTLNLNKNLIERVF